MPANIRAKVIINAWDAAQLTSLGRLGPPVLAAEIGVRRAETSVGLLETWPGLTLHLVDPFKQYPDSHPSIAVHGSEPIPQTTYDEWFRISVEAVKFAGDRAVFRKCDSAEAAKGTADRSMDFVFIDADHYYEGVSFDIRTWFEKIRDGGILFGHDYKAKYDKPGRRNSPPRWGVSRAVDEFVAERGISDLKLAGTMWWFEVKH